LIQFLEMAVEELNPASSESNHEVDEKTLRNDETELSVVSDGEVQIDSSVEARITKKFDRRIVPWLFGLWLLAFIDRSNIGNARIDGLSTDLNLGTGPKYNTALAIFYVPYICVDVPSNWLIKRVGAGYYLPGLVVSWGIISIGIGFVRTYESLLAVRFLLGIFEGGLLGGMILYLSMFYRRHQLMQRIGLFYCAAPLSGAFGGLLATGLSQITTPGYNGW
jgi:MFS family permease